ncbi:MAG TPA: alginate lyase family protein [Chitinophagaceae bacterium]|jgi:hypothetical protein|nr:alginate lyase family protein [Chitinophagaceae bacterium]
MKKAAVFIVSISFMVCSTASAHRQPGTGKPVVFVLDAAALAANKSNIQAGDAAALAAYKLLIKDANAALKFGPVSVMEKKNDPPSGNKHDYMSLAPYHWPDPTKADGLPYIRKDGETNPEVKEYKDKEYMPKLCAEVHTLALAYYFSDDKVYAEHAAKLVRVWFLDTATRMNPNLNFAQAIRGVTIGRGAGMIDSRHFVKLIDAIGLLQGSKYWTGADQKGMQQWFGELLQWMATSKNGIDEMNAGNNHGAWYDAQKLSMALFTGNMELAKKTVVSAQDRLDKQMDDAGQFPKEMERTTSMHYTTFVMEAFFNIALMADDAGMDLWNYTSPSGKSLKNAFDVLRPYLIKKKEWQGQQIKDFEYEEGYFLLMEAGRRFNCKSCRDEVRSLAGDKAERLRINLFY